MNLIKITMAVFIGNILWKFFDHYALKRLGQKEPPK